MGCRKVNWALGAVFICANASAAQLFFGGERLEGPALLPIAYLDEGSVRVYDDFDLTARSQVQALTVDFIVDPLFNLTTGMAEFEIRSGMSAGIGGNLLASGDALSSYARTGRTAASGWVEWRLTVPVALTLDPGRYWLMARGANGFISFTEGANGIGGPINNGNAFGSSVFVGPNWNFEPLGVNDFSYGVEGSAIPEPATLVCLGLGIGLLARRRS